MDYINNIKNFVLLEFSNICLVIAIAVLISNTFQMSQDPRSIKEKDEKVYNYYVYNIVSSVFLGIFIFNMIIENVSINSK